MKRFLLGVLLAPLLLFSQALSWRDIYSNLSSQEKEFLEVFFRALFLDSYCGYVVFGDKPVCIEAVSIMEGEAIPASSINLPGTKFHKLATRIKQGMQVWKKFPRSQKFIPRLSEKSEYGGYDFVFINRDLFLKTVKTHLILFQYVLGPKLTAEKLLEKLEDPKESFLGALNYDRVLIGLLLGFGVNNALGVSRLEDIDEYLYILKENPPEKKEENSQRKTFYGNIDGSPSFGFLSLEQECKSLRQDKSVTVQEAFFEKPGIPWFGFWGEEESANLIKNYILARKKIINAVNSKIFLESLLQKIYE